MSGDDAFQRWLRKKRKRISDLVVFPSSSSDEEPPEHPQRRTRESVSFFADVLPSVDITDSKVLEPMTHQSDEPDSS